MPSLALRADAASRLGTGHVMRCLTLALELRARGWDPVFVCRVLEGDLIDFLRQRHHLDVLALPVVDDADWREDAAATTEALRRHGPRPDLLVVDSYQLDARWETALRPHAGRLLVLDDLADRPHDCDLLHDQNPYDDPEARYRALAPARCQRLLGPAHALLRPEFLRARQAPPERPDRSFRVLVSFGGADITNETARVVEALEPLAAGGPLRALVVAGSASPNLEALRALCARRPWTELHAATEALATLMASADLAIGAAGTSTLERCCVGLPTLCITIADNQRVVAEAVHRAGALAYLGHMDHIGTAALTETVARWIADGQGRRAMSERARRLVDGRGVARVADRCER